MKSVLISIRPQWCELIASGQKTVEVRKSRPKIPTPFKCYIYETRGKKAWTDIPVPEDQGGGEIRDLVQRGGKVIGEFVCDDILEACWDYEASCGGDFWGDNLEVLDGCCLTDDEIFTYLGRGKTGSGCGWHISDLRIYDKPRELSSFTGLRKAGNWEYAKKVERAPQSWKYVEYKTLQ